MDNQNPRTYSEAFADWDAFKECSAQWEGKNEVSSQKRKKKLIRESREEVNIGR